MFLDPNKKIDRHRGNLPHWQQGEAWIFVTWRLADSLPKAIVEKLAEQRLLWETAHPKPWAEETHKEHNRRFTLAFELLLDDSHGSCLLRDPGASEVVTNALFNFHGDRYELDCFVVMPNHVHVLFRPLGEHRLEDILHTWKRFTAREINKITGNSGTMWQREYWDRLIRSQRHLDWTREYIRENPKKLPSGCFRLWQSGEGV